MLTLGPLGFVNPWLLFALAGLPILWWLLRVTPPAPKRLSFPAIRLLFGLQPPEETPARTPWWLIALRMLLAALVIVGLARPILNPSAQLAGSGPVVIVVDNGWAAAANWAARERLLGELLDQAERDRRAVVLATTAPDGREAAETRLSALPPAEARRIAQSIQPRPWAVDRPLAAERLRALALEEAATVVWLSDGLESGSEPDAAEFAQALADLGSVQIYRDVPGDLPRLLLPPEIDTASLILRAGRVATDTPDSLTVRASDDRGRLVTQQTLDFEPEAAETSQALTLPIELRNRITRLDIEGEAGAGAVLFLDERWRRRPVGLVSTGPLESAQPLLSELYYLERALAPFTEISRGDIGQLMNRGVAVIALPDLGPLPPEQATALERWVEAGGLLLRFAGPRLAESDDGLLPVELRRGGRIMGGALTWSDPAELAPFAHDSPFAGLLLPEDVAVSRQVLAEPALDLPEKTWAQLTDGTPLVTAEPRGQGWLALVHTTANTEWSDLPLSGLFVEMPAADRGGQPRRQRCQRGSPAAPVHPRWLRPARKSAGNRFGLDGRGRRGRRHRSAPPARHLRHRRRPASAQPRGWRACPHTHRQPTWQPGGAHLCWQRRAGSLALAIDCGARRGPAGRPDRPGLARPPEFAARRAAPSH